jgi:hypothetical protein
MIIKGRAPGEQICWSEPWTGFSARTVKAACWGELVKAVLERALEAELTGHLGYARHDPFGHNSGNSRNGTINKKVQTGIGGSVRTIQATSVMP